MPSKFYVWVDCQSIPQTCHFTQELAISTLTIYCTLCTYFCIVANTAIHADIGAPCDLKSYHSRGWCRLEQFARLTAHFGNEAMFQYANDELEPVEVDFSHKTAGLFVQSGNFTCCQRGHPGGATTATSTRPWTRRSASTTCCAGSLGA